MNWTRLEAIHMKPLPQINFKTLLRMQVLDFFKLILHLFRHIRYFLQLLVGRFIEDQGLKNAASLSYTVTLSIVPLMTVILAVFSAFPMAEKLSIMIQNFIFLNFVPTSGLVLEQYFTEFSSKASRLPGTGTAFLVLIALMLISTVNDALNHIWRVKKKRRILSQFLVYWSMLTLGPLLIGLSVAATSYMISLPLFVENTKDAEIKQIFIKMMPLISSFIAFTLMYSIVPNRKVPYSHAIYGGMAAALLFEFTKAGFGLYLQYFPTYQAIYGALAIIPVFLVWVYISWVIILLGAEFTYCLGLYWHYYERKSVAGDHLIDVYRIIKELRMAQSEGVTIKITALSKVIKGLPEERIESLLLLLQKQNLVVNTSDGGWVLAKDLSYVTLMDIYKQYPWVLPDQETIKEMLPDEKIFIQATLSINHKINDELSLSLEYFLNGEVALTHAILDNKNIQ